MKNNYPIKYALIPMTEQVGWSIGMHELEREYGTVCYIVSKVYLIKEETNYNKKGSIEKKYLVVCPFVKSSWDYTIWNYVEPEFNLIHGQCSNGIIVDELFDNYEDALEAKKQKNSGIFIKMISQLCYYDYKSKRDMLEKEFNEKLAYYDKLEDKIANQTTDLNNDNIKEQTVIYFNSDKKKKLNDSLYEIINIFGNENYMVYSVTKEEYDRFALSEENFARGTPLLVNNKDLKVAKIFSDDNCYYLKDNQLVNNLNNEFNCPKDYDAFFVTQETYDDLIKSYENSKKNIKIRTLKKKI